MRRLLLHVQTLLGIGHLRRAAAVARAAVGAGFDVTVASGGMPVPDLDIGGARLFQLPAVRTRDSDFRILVDAQGRQIDDDWRRLRRDTTLALFERIRPDVLVTELFPFGRRQLRFELLPLLEAARGGPDRPVIVSSMRDILVTKPRADRNREIVETLHAYYDRVLVHGDRRVITLASTFPDHRRIARMIEYTGYVMTPWHAGNDEGRGEIVVSAGGGAVGGTFMTRVMQLRGALPAGGRPWRFVTGPHMPEEFASRLRPAPGVTVERSRADLPALVANADLSISQAGYNTLAEVLAAGTPAVVIPFEGGVETEQRLRADLLAKRGALEVVAQDRLAADTLGAAMRQALDRGRQHPGGVRLDGAARTAGILHRLVDAR